MKCRQYGNGAGPQRLVLALTFGQHGGDSRRELSGPLTRGLSMIQLRCQQSL